MSKKGKPTDEELQGLFEGLEGDGTSIQAPKSATGNKQSDQSDADLLEELGIPERPKPSSRPHTPRLQSASTTPGTRSSPKLTRAVTPASADGARSSEEKASQRKSGESTRSFHNSFTPASSGEGENEPEKSASFVPEAVQAQSSGGGWWGSVFSTASAAVKQAEALAKEIRQNEEAQRWAEQVKGNVGALRGLGTVFILRSSCRSGIDIDTRRRTSLSCPPNFHQHSTHPRSTHLVSRASTNSHHTRHRWVPLSRSPNLLHLLSRHGTSRGWRPHGNPARARVHFEARRGYRLHGFKQQWLERWALVEASDRS